MRSWWAVERQGGKFMKAFRIVILTAVAASSFAQNHAASGGRRESSNTAKLVGAWHLVDMTGPDGKPVSTLPAGMLIYTRDGHMSVQLMYPGEQSAFSDRYVQSGYEASFGRYDVDLARHIVTHHVQGSVTRDALAGKDLPRVYEFTKDAHLVIRSAHPDEHWSATWEHY
jgi:hypothetical protein